MWVDDSSESVAERVERRRIEVQENANGTADDVPSDDSIYLEVVGGLNKRGNVYGLGGLGDQYTKETQGVPFLSQVPTTLPYVEKITNLEGTVSGLQEELGEKNKEIGDILATL
ncbi:hypothetical protein RIF29_28680 [Crotalaria pallida]|uniref:Uncharacterized protein n=1 Tax=Crotalaria pallida TaxID=3830 RepID=A0AAN9EJT3_CROPI